MNKFILTLGFLLLYSTVYSQEKIILEGRIIADSLENSRINILNITKNIGTTNSDLGEFKIEVQEDDILLFSSVQYERVQIKISKKNIIQKFLKVILTKKVIDLNEVMLSKIGLTGNLSGDIENIKTYDYYEGIPLSKIPRLTSLGRQLYTARDGDIDPLLNMIIGRMQMLEKANENEQLTFDVQEGIDAIEPSVFILEFQIPEEEIINFVYYCATSPIYRKLIENDSYLELIEFFREKAPDYKKLREIKQAASNE
ncbi:hypothetical protein LB465_03060 [Salegentibacter sp. LM13S]|uniref:hypothetical protein n=1 Tax=Salegentibacter lacus TaxID=2873599 RepID=UPI001CC9E00F|nr:hypothetical protein [Salegentibacter lacus]MBZ9629746.1 hypothetical protein [Salegentibacter lacus]